MSTMRISPPEADEYAAFHAAYVALVRERDPGGVLKRQVPVLRSVCTGMTDAEALHRYAPEKWTVKEVLGHLCDTERLLSYRLFRISRGDPTALSGFDENAYVAAGELLCPCPTSKLPRPDPGGGRGRAESASLIGRTTS